MDRCIFGNFLLSWINKCYEKTHPQGQTHTGDVNNYYYNVGAAVGEFVCGDNREPARWDRVR
jgi:hypothetical protein